MFDLPSCEIRLTIVDDAIDAGYKLPLLLLVAHSLYSFDDCAIDGIDLIDDVVVVVADDASLGCQILRRRMMACEMSAKKRRRNQIKSS